MKINKKLSIKAILSIILLVFTIGVTGCNTTASVTTSNSKISDVTLPYYIKKFIKTEDIATQEKKESEVAVNTANTAKTEEEKEKEKLEVENAKIATLTPVSMSLPTLGETDIDIQPVGDDSQGRMATISNGTTIAWYTKSASPGSSGQSWLAGHNDWAGQVGTFGRIKELNAGDPIFIKYNDGSEIKFEVTNNETYALSDVPDEYLNFGGEERTTLITCYGEYIADLGGSQSRTLVTIKKVNN